VFSDVAFGVRVAPTDPLMVRLAPVR